MTSPLAGKRVLVVGLGVSGFSAARALDKRDAKVRVTEGGSGGAIEGRAEQLRSAGIEVETGGHDPGRLDADLVVVSPGIPPTAPVMKAVTSSGIEVWSEVELAYRLADCDFLAVTGTNGKTTTTTLLAAMLAESKIPTVAAGNIGYPLIDAIEEIPAGGAIAVEVSSFQLEATHEFRPRVSVLLNVAEDHTDWHGTFERYAAAKARIVANQTGDDLFLPCLEDPVAMDIASRARAVVAPFSAQEAPSDGCGYTATHLVWRGVPVVASDAVPLEGVAGRHDTAAAAGAALGYGADTDAVARAIRSFRPLHHRMEVVARVDDITFIDDSKATNPHATLAAVKGLRDVVLIAGGRSKGIDLSVLATTVPTVRAVVALGEAAEEIEKVFGELVPVARVASMDEAVAAAEPHLISGGSVLLSPGCASLDMYESYAARGEDFARAVRAWLDRRGREGRVGDGGNS